MGLSVYLEVVQPVDVYTNSITHNLNKMALASGLYEALWRPEEVGYKLAKDLIYPLTTGLAELTMNPEKYKQYNPENGWGSYEGLVKFVEEYLQACKDNPEAEVRACR